MDDSLMSSLICRRDLRNPRIKELIMKSMDPAAHSENDELLGVTTRRVKIKKGKIRREKIRVKKRSLV